MNGSIHGNEIRREHAADQWFLWLGLPAQLVGAVLAVLGFHGLGLFIILAFGVLVFWALAGLVYREKEEELARYWDEQHEEALKNGGCDGC